MTHWKIRLAAAGIGCAALLMTPVTMTALGTERQQSAYTVTFASQPSDAGAALVREDSSPQQAQPLLNAQTPPAQPADAAAAAAQAQAHAEAVQTKAPDLEEQIRHWAASLSKEKGFEAWSGASLDIYPLGPGTHSWVILLRSRGQELGYMVVTSTEDGAYKLMEYGTGGSPLFSMETLYHSLVQRGLISDTVTYTSFLQLPPVSLIRWYAPPLQAVWQVAAGARGTVYLDAKTGEELPDIGAWIAGLGEGAGPAISGNASTPSGSGGPVAAVEWEPHDPFIKPAWLKGQPMDTPGFEAWKSAATAPGARMVYSGKWYGGKAVYPLAVSGYHIWDAKLPFVRLEHHGSRYVPYADMGRLGGFYP